MTIFHGKLLLKEQDYQCGINLPIDIFFRSLAEYVNHLEKSPAEVANLYRELLIGVTSFFRDREAYDRLAHKWLPELIRNKSDRNLRLWVVGCSTGEEAYTLAILCRECLADHDKSLDVKIFATPKEAIENNCEPVLYDIDREAEQRIHDLEQQLQFTRENSMAGH